MTSVGKILAFFNLIFAVGTCALIAIVFSTRANWKAEHDRIRNQALVLEAALKEADFRHKSELRSKDEEIEARKAAEINLQNQVTKATQAEATAKADLDKATASKNTAVENQKLAETEVKRLQDERDVLGKEKVEREKTIFDLTKTVNAERQKAVQADNDKKTALYRAEKLLEQVEDITRQREALRAQLGTLTSGNTGNIGAVPVAPAPKDVRGAITEVTENGLAAISIGTNQGLNVGNKLEVYRIDRKNPKNSAYLGELYITRVRPSDAVGQFKPANARIKLPEIGDEVAATLSSR